jgi:hypothetical protein
MARPIEWFQRLPWILEALEQPGTSLLLNRRDVEQLFGVSPRTALHLLTRFGAMRIGNILALPKDQLVAALRKITSEDDYQLLKLRHDRLIERLSEHREDLRLSRITLPEPATNRLGELPASIRLEPGRLTVKFSDAVDLLGQLLELSRAIGEDFDRFEGILNQDPLSE